MSSRPSARWRWPPRSRSCRPLMSKQRKTDTGNFFEDFRVGQEIRHATPRTLTEADAALNIGALRLALRHQFVRRVRPCARPAARAARRPAGVPCRDRQDGARHLAQCRRQSRLCRVPLGRAGLSRRHAVGVARRCSACARIPTRQSGVVWVRSTGTNQRGEMVLDYVRWVMVHKRDRSRGRRRAGRAEDRAGRGAGRPDRARPDSMLAATTTRRPARPIAGRTTRPASGSTMSSGMTLEESDHMFSTRLYQNTARVHFDAFAGKNTRFGRRLAYGGHVISLARALSLQRPRQRIPRRGDQRRQPCRARPSAATRSMPGRRCSRRRALPGRTDIGALRVRTIAAKDCPCGDLPGKGADGKYHPAVVLDLDYWLLMPRRRLYEFRWEIRGLTSCTATFVDLRRPAR